MKIVIYASGDPLGNTWVVSAYDDETDEHLWSSESATSLEQGLQEVSAGIRLHAAASDDAGHPDAAPLSNNERDPIVPDGAQSAAPPSREETR